MNGKEESTDTEASTVGFLRSLLDAEIRCEYKAYLKLKGEVGDRSDYELLCQEKRENVNTRATDKILKSCAPDEVQTKTPLTTSSLQEGRSFILDAVMQTDLGTLHFDGVKKVPGYSKLGAFHYIPLLFLERDRVARADKAYLEVCGHMLSTLHDRQPDRAAIYLGETPRLTTLRLTPDLRNGRTVWSRLGERFHATSPPQVILNTHCQMCEFQEQCKSQAIAEDNLSLLDGIKPKELANYANKGIFTVTQLAHTFRPRRRSKRSLQRTPHYHALKAMAVRDDTIYVFGTPELPHAAVKIYLDVEGDQRAGHVYLIGMIITDGTWEKRYSFWADDSNQELAIFQRFIATLEQYQDFVVFTYGAYEGEFLNRMRNAVKSKSSVDRVLDRLVNVLSLIYSHVYFPCYSNGPKAIGKSLGFSWSDRQASGLQSLVWRARWEATKIDDHKRMLLDYNRDDCAALKRVTDCINTVLTGHDFPSQYVLPAGGEVAVSIVGDNRHVGYEWAWETVPFAQPDFEHINKCAYFDYQRERVYIRTSKAIRRDEKSRRKRINQRLKISQHIQIPGSRCPSCKATTTVPITAKERQTDCPIPRTKRAYDLAFTPSSVKRRVLGFQTAVHQCTSCEHEFVPEEHVRLDRHFHNLKSFVMYLHVGRRLSLGTAASIAEEIFGIHLHRTAIHAFKSLMASFYRDTYRQILKTLVSGSLIHADETEAPLKDESGYVWVFTNMEEVYFIYRPTREGAFLKDLLRPFDGVLVSDFYAVYDSLDCAQQKCLVHLIRDMNQAILAAPYNKELRLITEPFGTLLRSIVETIDRAGLKRRALCHHVADVDVYFKDLATKSLISEPAISLRNRLTRYQNKLFTFIGHDGIPWNNNNAESAIKKYADYRSRTRKRLNEKGLRDYLVLLSISETCRYKGVSFLRFMLSRMNDVDAFSKRKRLRFGGSSAAQLYPKGFIDPQLASLRRRFGRGCEETEQNKDQADP